MRAAVYENFKHPVSIRDVPDPRAAKNGVVLRVRACGICRSDWHGWMGNDPDITLPNVPGHEIAGEVEETGENVRNWKVGDRVTVPFVCGCGACAQCNSGNHQVCDNQFQPGFTAWGAFAEYVAIDYADINLVRLPEEIDFVSASSLGCRFITSYRGVVHQGRVKAGEWVVVMGCGGVGLSAIMIASAVGANVIAVDISDDKLEFARSIGAAAVVNARNENTIEAVREITGGGANVSIDAIGHPQVFFDAISSLQKRGRHIQIGLMEEQDRNALIPIDKVIAGELEILGSHGMQAFRYPEIFELIRQGKLHPDKLIGKTVSLEESTGVLMNMNKFAGIGAAVINSF